MKPFRLLQAMAGARVGGAEAFFERLTRAFARRGLEQRVVIRHESERAARLRAAGIDVIQLDFGGLLDFSTRFTLARHIREYRPRVVLAWMSRAASAMPPRLLMGEARPVVVGRLGGYYKLKYYRRCDWLVANTADIAAWIVRQGWRSDRVVTVPNFVDAEIAPPIDRVAFATPDGAPVALALGRLHENKAFDVLIDAAARLPGLHVWIAGEGPREAELRAQTAELGLEGRVRFLGWRNDVGALLAAADLLVCPSRHEPLGNVVIEGWAHRRPVVAAASEGPRQLMTDGAGGLLVPVDDPDALAAAIGRVIAEPRLAARLAAGGRDAYEAGFTEEVVVRRWLEFLARVGGVR